jgi:short-subunit dehydrogenase
LGTFVGQGLDRSLGALAVNCRGPLELLHLLLPGMIERRRGAVVLMSSLTAFQGTPYTAVYGATKAFNLALAEALWAELRGSGVEVLACCAGATRTPGYLKAMPHGAPGELEPEEVVEATLDRIGRGPLLIPGAFNKLASFFMRRVLPRRAAVMLMAAQTKRLER